MSNIEFPEGLKKLNNDAFKGAKLTSIVLPNSLDEIGGQCFRENLFSEITIPKNIQYIANMAFWDCKKLRKVIFEPTVPPTFNGSSVFYGCPSDLKIYVPDTSLNAYKTAEFYDNLANKIYPISSLTD